jgi:hypothetical protein
VDAAAVLLRCGSNIQLGERVFFNPNQPSEAFEHTFGAGREAPMLHPDSPTEVLYYPAAPAERHHTCAIIARVGADGVRAVAVRRDPRV